ncbi:MAG TPA: GNAT family protein [Solirubrobacteraceae bacterium]|nr:GNAT family protein [Solirubrobacteraceae bacterium]
MPAIPVPSEPLGDGLVALRPTAERDIPEILIAYQDDPHMHERLGQPRAPSGADLGRAAEQATAELAAGLRLALTIVQAGLDTCLGQVAIGQLDWENLRGELVVWLAPGVRGRGYAPAAIRLAAGWAFGHCGIDRLALLVEPDNAAMLRAAAKAGAHREGVLRSYRATRRARTDMALVSLVPSDLD